MYLPKIFQILVKQHPHRYSVIRSDLKKRGRPIPENDIWIAASCIELDVPLVTRDSHFSSVYDLKLVQWDE